MGSYEEGNVKVINNQLNKLTSTAKNNTGTTLRITKKNVQSKNYLKNNY